METLSGKRTQAMHKCPHQEKRTLRLVKWKTQVPTGTSQTPPWGRQPPTQALLDHYFRETETDDVNSSFIKMLLHPDFTGGREGSFWEIRGSRKGKGEIWQNSYNPPEAKKGTPSLPSPSALFPGRHRGRRARPGSL